MTDISELVQRLREPWSHQMDELCLEAADVLERLRLEIDALDDMCDRYKARAEAAEAELAEARLTPCTQAELDRAADSKDRHLLLMWKERAEQAEARLAMIMSDSQGN